MILAKIATALISPLGSALVVGLFGLILGFLGRRRSALLCHILAIGWLWFWSLPIVSLWLAKHIEAPFPPQHPAQVAQAEAIVVLGGGVTPANHHRLQPDLNQAADRVWYGAQLFHAKKAPLLVLSGGYNPALYQHSAAAAMQQFALDLGVPAQAMLLEEQSRNTQQNAEFTARLLQQRGISTILLVTSAQHMQRALQHFQHTNLQVIPAATDYQLSYKSGWRRWIPAAEDLDKNARLLKEYVGQWLGASMQWRMASLNVF